MNAMRANQWRGKADGIANNIHDFKKGVQKEAVNQAATRCVAPLVIVKGAKRLGKTLKGSADDVADVAKSRKAAPKSSKVASVLSKIDLYPKAIDPRTGRHVPFPSGIGAKVDKSLRVSWDGKLARANFIAEWHRRGYATPKGGWDKYDVHHIHPREFGGTNGFWNLVPVDLHFLTSLYSRRKLCQPLEQVPDF